MVLSLNNKINQGTSFGCCRKHDCCREKSKHEHYEKVSSRKLDFGIVASSLLGSAAVGTAIGYINHRSESNNIRENTKLLDYIFHESNIDVQKLKKSKSEPAKFVFDLYKRFLHSVCAQGLDLQAQQEQAIKSSFKHNLIKGGISGLLFGAGLSTILIIARNMSNIKVVKEGSNENSLQSCCHRTKKR